MSPDTRSVLNQSCGWIVAVWLAFAFFSDGFAAVGAMSTVALWAILTRYLEDSQ